MFYRLKKIIPASWMRTYHLALSWCAAFWYGFPSEELIVIGVTGTNGKTTTSYFISKALEASGKKTGCTTTALFKIDKQEWLNDSKMTMLGRFALQKMLRRMVDAGCTYAVVESSSQGIVQFRHRGINFDLCVFTNLTPEHIEAHGGFENYKQAKIDLFQHVAKSARKILEGVRIPKIAILNSKSVYAKEFAVPGFDQVVWYGEAHDIQEKGWSTQFTFEHVRCEIHVPGLVNIENALAALTVAKALHIDLQSAAQALASILSIPGRFERILEGQDFEVIVDYAPEPAALAAVYASLAQLPHKRIIHVLGSCGGGRDIARRPVLGRMASEHADYIIITNEDPYDDDPLQIIEDVAQGARNAGAGIEKLHTIPDRRAAIVAAIQEATQGDLVLLTGKGCEQAIIGAQNTRFPWDERQVAREAIREKLRYTLKDN